MTGLPGIGINTAEKCCRRPFSTFDELRKIRGNPAKVVFERIAPLIMSLHPTRSWRVEDVPITSKPRS